VPFWLPLAPQRFTHPAGRVLGQLADDVGVGAQGQADLRVAEDLHRYPRRHSLLKQQGRGGVAGVVQAGVRTPAAASSSFHSCQSARAPIGRPSGWAKTRSCSCHSEPAASRSACWRSR